MKVPRLPCLVAACSVALGTLSAFPVSAAEKVTYTLSYVETAALFGYESYQVESAANANKIIVPTYNATSGNFGSTYAPNMWYANYTLNGIPYIGIRYYLNVSAIQESREMYVGINCQLQTALTLDNLYDFTVGAGFLTSYASATGTDERVQVSFWNNAEHETLSNSFVSPYPLMSFVNVDTQRSSSGTALELSPVAASLPVYDLYTAQGYPTNFLVRFDQPSYNTLSEPYDDEGVFTGYSYIFLRCPTITTEKDSLIDITDKLGEAVSKLEGIEDMLASSPEQDAAVSDRVQGIETGSQLVGDYNAAESSLMTEISLYNPNDYYVYDGDSVTWFGHFWRFVERMPFVVTFSSVGIMFAVLSYVLYGRK